MIVFDEISLKVTGSNKDEKENVISDFIIEKGAVTRYVITWTKRDIIGVKEKIDSARSTNSDYRDSKVETHIRNLEFEKEFKKLIEKHFELYIEALKIL